MKHLALAHDFRFARHCQRNLPLRLQQSIQFSISLYCACFSSSLFPSPKLVFPSKQSSASYTLQLARFAIQYVSSLIEFLRLTAAEEKPNGKLSEWSTMNAKWRICYCVLLRFSPVSDQIIKERKSRV